jgi:hypothetical protein
MDDPREAAIKRLKARRGFRQHLVTYAAVNGFLVVIWTITYGGYFWPVWPIAGWGIGLGMHGWSVYGERPITEAEIQREMKRDGDAAHPRDPLRKREQVE